MVTQSDPEERTIKMKLPPNNGKDPYKSYEFKANDAAYSVSVLAALYLEWPFLYSRQIICLDKRC